MIGIIASAIGGIVGDWFKNKRVEVKAKHEQKIAAIKHESTWDLEQARNAKTSWKDELITVVVLTPFIGMGAGAVLDKPWIIDRFDFMFQVLESKVPDEYWYLMGIVVAGSFGYKAAVKGIQKLRSK